MVIEAPMWSIGSNSSPSLPFESTEVVFEESVKPMHNGKCSFPVTGIVHSTEDGTMSLAMANGIGISAVGVVHAAFSTSI